MTTANDRIAALSVLQYLSSQVRSIPHKEALCYLEALVETGKERWFESLEKDGVIITEKEGRDSIDELLGIIGEDTLFTDPSFAFSLRLSICFIAHENADWRPLFLQRLCGIFRTELGERIFEYALRKITEDINAGKDVVPNEQEVREYCETQRNIILASATLSPYRAPHQMPEKRGVHHGTDTWMETCPQCGLEKRCDKRTKRFRCRCGFDQAYPYESTQ